MTEKCCGRTLGHGLSCTPDYLCDQCALIQDLQEELHMAEHFALHHCLDRLRGFDRDGYDLWWNVPNFYPQEAEYLLKKKVLARRKDGQVAWTERLREEHEA